MKVEDFRKHAKECRAMLVRSRTDDERKMLMQMAETWEALAEGRREQIERSKRVDLNKRS